MKIVLAVVKEESGSAVEETFSQPVIKIGRDASAVDLVFDNEQFRMVSRHHADIRFAKGRWLVGDMGSSYGTFLNGEKLEKPANLKVGSSVQFGLGGPKAHVIFVEGSASESTDVEAVKEDVAPSPPIQPPKPESAPVIDLPLMRSAPSIPKPQIEIPGAQNDDVDIGASVAVPLPSIEVEYGGKKNTVTVDSDSTWLGRDPACEVQIEASAVMVSRRHAEIRRDGSAWLLMDNQSFNGTLVNDNRISSLTPLYNGDRINLGHGGPCLLFRTGAAKPIEDLNTPPEIPNEKSAEADFSGTMVFNMPRSGGKADNGERQLLYQLEIDNKPLTIGRDTSNDITLDGLQISNRHARITRSGNRVIVEDANSTNGVYLNGERKSKAELKPGDTVEIGSFVVELDDYGQVCVFDTRSKMRIDAKSITKLVRDRNGSGKIKLLDDISLTIRPNEFVGLIGPSGAGKSTFMDALNGTRPPTDGSVFVNGKDLYRFIDHLKQSIGYVPQNEIIHEELTVQKTLYFIAKLRLSSDVSKQEIEQIIDEVLDVCGLTERRAIPISQLSGGQKKRVSIAVELITKPSIIFLDEPTSGLDPSTEEKIMRLFRQIAESGRTVILTTHAMENVKLFDKVVVLMRGKLVFYGKPEEALVHFGAKDFKSLFGALEAPVEDEIKERGESQRFVVTEREAAKWRDKFAATPQFESNVRAPISEIKEVEKSGMGKRNRLGLFGSIRQWYTLSRRYLSILFKDKFNLFILFAQAPVIAVLVFIVMGAEMPRDFVYFALSLCAIWFGTSVAAREIVRERKIYERERMVNLGILPYVISKYSVLGVIVFVQCVMLFVPLKLFDLLGLMPMPGFFFGLLQFFTMLVTAAVGIALGIFVSAIVKTSETATSLIPLILIPQIIFSGLIGVPTGISKVVGLTMPATWSFDTMKRLSTLDTLEPEGAFEKGKGLYKSVETRNDKMISDSKRKIREYEQKIESRIKDAEKRVGRGEQVTFQGLPERPTIGAAEKLPDDLSDRITFLHPWLNEFLSLFVLLMMSVFLFLGTVIILKLQDAFSYG